MATKPFFVPEKEIKLIDALNEELIDEVIGQTVDIYKVSLEETSANIYGEAPDGVKTFEKGFRVNCLIEFFAPEVEVEDFGSDLNSSIELNFHRNSLKDTDFYPEIGDIVDWNDFYFEINGTTEPQLIAGHPNFKHQIKATAHRMRQSSLQIEERPR